MDKWAQTMSVVDYLTKVRKFQLITTYTRKDGTTVPLLITLQR